MGAPVTAMVVFVAGAAISLAASWLLVSRIERFGVRFGLSESLVGLVAALAADAPEITSSVSAVVGHERDIGAGVVLGSNLFNLAALLGLAAVVAGTIRLHRRVALFEGAVSILIALAASLAVAGVLVPVAALVIVLLALLTYGLALALDVRGIERLPLPRRWCSWLCLAVGEEDVEMRVALPPAGDVRDAAAGLVALVVVVAASVAMERAASSLGRHFAIPGIVTGGLVLAAVTSLPNAVAAIYLARRGRGAAVLSTALNSNAINVAFGLLAPAVALGLGAPQVSSLLVVSCYGGLTLACVAVVARRRSVGRISGSAIIAAYGGFVVALLAVSLR